MPFGNSEIRRVELTYNMVNNRPILNKFSFNCAERVQNSLQRGRETSEGFIYSINDGNNLKSAIVKNNKIASTDGRSYLEIDNSIGQPFKIDHKINLPTIIKSNTNEFSGNLVSKHTL